MTETQLKEKVKAYAQKLGLFPIKIAGGPRQRAGISDLLIVIPPRGKLLALELKAPGKLREVTPLQMEFLRKIDQAGGIAVAVDTLDAARQIIDWAMIAEARQLELNKTHLIENLNADG